MMSSWSRRRAAVAAEAVQEDVAAQEAALAEERDTLAEKTDSEILEELGLPDPDSLGLGDDFKGFMSNAVPEHLRKRALRKLWRSNPVLACVDGLNDYDDDYLAQSLGQGAIKTSYQVGKGMLAHLLEMERQKEAAAESKTADQECDDDDAPEVVAESTEASIDITVEKAQRDEEVPPVAPRRMQFQFEDDTA